MKENEILSCINKDIHKYQENWRECQYCDEDQFGKFDSDVGQGALRIFSMNIQSLPKHKEELLAYLSNLSRFDVLVLTEIGARNIDLTVNFFGGYNFLYILPDKNVYGGVGIYVSDSLNDIFLINSQFKKDMYMPQVWNWVTLDRFHSLWVKIYYMWAIPTPEWRWVTFHKRLGTHD